MIIEAENQFIVDVVSRPAVNVPREQPNIHNKQTEASEHGQKSLKRLVLLRILIRAPPNNDDQRDKNEGESEEQAEEERLLLRDQLSLGDFPINKERY
jgi:hypothetical protein